MQKKENKKAKEEIQLFSRLIDQRQEEEGIEEPIEVDGFEEQEQVYVGKRS